MAGTAWSSGDVTIEREDDDSIEWQVFEQSQPCGHLKWNGFGWMFVPLNNYCFDVSTLTELVGLMQIAREDE